MTDKQIIIDGVDVSGCCHYNKKTSICSNGFRVDEIPYCNCFTCNYKRWKVAEKQLKAKEQECEELRQYHNKCCEEFEKEKKEWLEKYNQVSRDFYSGKYCNAEKCQQLDQLKAENEELKKKCNIYTCGICGNKEDCNKLYKTLTEIKEIAKPYQRDIYKICGYCRKYDSCHACCIDDLKDYEYRTGATKACERFVELERFNINIVANLILQKISECEGNDE